MITNLSDIPFHQQGIYIIHYDDDKIYIGQSQDIKKRGYEHNNKCSTLCDKVLKNQNAIIFILELVDDSSKLDEIESKYIEQYNSTNPEIGYNVLKFTNVADKRGMQHPNSKINQEILLEIIDLLENNIELSYADIAKKYNVSSSTIGCINKGKRYYQKDLQYPIRKKQYVALRKCLITDYFSSEKDLELLKEDLKYDWELSIESDLPVKYGIPKEVVRDINHGRKFAEIGNYEYPIRKKNFSSHLDNRLTKQDVLDILNLLSSTTITMSKIGEKYGIHRNVISSINLGKTYRIKNYEYPARLTH